MKTEVLIVDDSLDFARSARDLVAERTGLVTECTSDPTAALQMMEQDEIAVVVLDQRMPLMTGTQLFHQLRVVRPNFRAIMLTAEATADEVGQAIPLGYGDFLSKSRIEELPERVFLQFVQALAARAPAVREGGKIIWRPNFIVRRWKRIALRLVSVSVLNERFVAEGDWRTVLQLQAGEEQKFTYRASDTRSFTLDNESRQLLQGSMKLQARPLAAAVTSLTEASRTTRQSATMSSGLDRGSERTLSLPLLADPDNGRLVRSRHFQQAPIGRKVLLHIEVERRCCGVRETQRALAIEQTGAIATRHQDYLNDGTVRIVETGDLQ